MHRVERLKDAIHAHNIVLEQSDSEVQADGSIVKRSSYDTVKRKREYAKQLEEEVMAERRAAAAIIQAPVRSSSKKRKQDETDVTIGQKKKSGGASGKASGSKVSKAKSKEAAKEKIVAKEKAVAKEAVKERAVATVKPYNDEERERERDMFEDSFENDQMILDEL